MGQVKVVKDIYSKQDDEWLKLNHVGSGSTVIGERIKCGYLNDDGELIIEVY